MKSWTTRKCKRSADVVVVRKEEKVRTPWEDNVRWIRMTPKLKTSTWLAFLYDEIQLPFWSGWATLLGCQRYPCLTGVRVPSMPLMGSGIRTDKGFRGFSRTGVHTSVHPEHWLPEITVPCDTDELLILYRRQNLSTAELNAGRTAQRSDDSEMIRQKQRIMVVQ